jgi:Zn-dependent protease
MSTAPSLRIFGFPVDVRPGFVMLLALFAFINQGEVGLWLAGCVGIFTLIHELGHAFAARATGAKASIALDFLAGYASFEPTRPLKRWERAGISIAGPAVQIVLGIAVLAAMGVNPLNSDQVHSTAPALAVWWAGPIIGLVNLLPILPLDGGNIVMSGLDAIIPGRARTAMVYFSIAVTGGGIVVLAAGRHAIGPFFLIFPLLTQLQMLQHRRTQASLDEHGTWQGWAASAERAAWTTGTPGNFPPGMTVSPWFRAAQLARGGHLEDAARLLTDDFANVQSPNWMPPDAASPAELEALVGLLPRPLPEGNPYSEYVVATALVRLREFDQAGRYAAELYRRFPGTMPAVVVAQCAAALGDDELAVKWLQAAYAVGTNLNGLAEAIDERTEFSQLRERPEVAQLRHELAAAAG